MKLEILKGENRELFSVSAALVIVFVALGSVFSKSLGGFFKAAQTGVIETFGWFYVLCVALFFVFVLWLGFSRFSGIKLGKDDDHPEFRYAVEVHAHRESKSYFPSMDNSGESPGHCRARIVLPSGNKEFRNLDEFSREGIIEDFLDSYDKWMGWEQDGGSQGS